MNRKDKPEREPDGAQADGRDGQGGDDVLRAEVADLRTRVNALWERLRALEARLSSPPKSH